MRQSGGKKVPVALQRMRAEDLLAAVFPEQVMCQDNRAGPADIPDHGLHGKTAFQKIDTYGKLELHSRFPAEKTLIQGF
jgi:ATP-dependent helicase Lhr and Lhr-like helicase